MLAHGLCEWCYLSDQLDGLFGDGPVDLAPLKQTLCEVVRPDSMVIWLYNQDCRTLLTSLASGACPLSHDGLDGFSSQRTGDHFRALLIKAGMLEPRNETLAQFDKWITERFPTTPTAETGRQLIMFARWYQRPGLETDPGTDSRMRGRCQEIKVAAQFLTYLHAKGEDPATLTQRSVDEWWASPPTTHRRCRPFLKWLLETQQVDSNITIPTVISNIHPPLSQAERLEHLAAMLDPDTGPLHARTAGILLLLLAQPFHKIVRLKRDDIKTEAATTIRIGLDPCPVPVPFDTVLQAQTLAMTGRNTATNSESPWLFPGRLAGQHIKAGTLRSKVRDLGIDLRAARSATLDELVKYCPPAIVADMLDYRYNTVDKHASRSGVNWSRYPGLKKPGT